MPVPEVLGGLSPKFKEGEFVSVELDNLPEIIDTDTISALEVDRTQLTGFMIFDSKDAWRHFYQSKIAHLLQQQRVEEVQTSSPSYRVGNILGKR